MLSASLFVAPLWVWQPAPALLAPVALGAGIGVAVTSSVVPCILDQLVMDRIARATYALMVALLPATATVIGITVLRQLPTPAEVADVALIVIAIVVHHEHQQRGLSARESHGSATVGNPA
ncbi:hypothetical protein [Actinopolymorpha alba]|uniref:hypothetical protein n=1 Tax=Actinopolymorpha alba TaxID=533267 RepID=UPI00036C6057|nr:hypothetical protein [Actinopolymorpha alba]